jgi:hypothetical protein
MTKVVDQVISENRKIDSIESISSFDSKNPKTPNERERYFIYYLLPP